MVEFVSNPTVTLKWVSGHGKIKDSKFMAMPKAGTQENSKYFTSSSWRSGKAEQTNDIK